MEKGEDYPIQFIVLDSELILKSCEEASADEHGIRDQYVEVLKPIAGKSQPHFLFFLSGVLRKKVVGVNTPIIQKSVDRLLADIDEGKNTGEEGLLDFEDEDDVFTQTPRNVDAGATEDKQFFDTMTTEEIPPDSARSNLSQSGLKFEPLKVYISNDGSRRLYTTTAVDGDFTEVSMDDPSFSLGFIAPSSESENFSRVLYSYYNPETKDTVLVSSPQDIQLYNDSSDWTDSQLIGFLFEAEREQTLALRSLSLNNKHVYTTDSSKVEELIASGYTDEGILGYLSEVDIIPVVRTPISSRPVSASRSSRPVSASRSSRPVSAKTPVELASPRDAEAEDEESQGIPLLSTESKPESESVENASNENVEASEIPTEEPKSQTPILYRIQNLANNLVIEINHEGEESKDVVSGSETNLIIKPVSDSWKQQFFYDGQYLFNEASGLRIHHGNQSSTPFACMVKPSDEKHQIWILKNGCLINELDGKGLTIASNEEGGQVDIRSFDIEDPPTDCKWQLIEV